MTYSVDMTRDLSDRSLHAAAPASPFDPGADIGQESAWIEVIRKMDETYADLVHHQVELEEKNAALEEAQRFIASVQAAMTDVLLVCDPSGRIQKVNRALERIVGRDEAQLRGTQFQDLFTPECRAMVEGFADKIRRDTIHDCELTLKGASEAVPLALNCASRYDHRGRLVGMVLIGRPVGELRRAYEALNQAHDELKQAQQQLVNAEKMASLGRLVAGVAHELNNPISFVYGNVHALQRYAQRLGRYLAAVGGQEQPPALAALRDELRIDRILEDLEPLLNGTLEGAERVRDIVQDLRRFSSGQQGEHAAFDLGHVLATAVHWVTKGARRELSTELELPERLECVGHAGQLHQVVMNLVQNAIDATAGCAVPRVSVRAGQAADRVWFSVRDNGPGIAADDLLRVFDPFFTTKPVGQGTGLGLSISYGIVAEHGGTLTVRNHPDGGAEFRVELPAGGGA